MGMMNPKGFRILFVEVTCTDYMCLRFGEVLWAWRPYPVHHGQGWDTNFAIGRGGKSDGNDSSHCRSAFGGKGVTGVPHCGEFSAS
jgi:hypothetical protein